MDDEADRPESADEDWQCLIISGGGRYTDAWHPFAETTEAVAGIARGLGHDVVVRDDPDEALAELGRTPLEQLPDLLIFNVGAPTDGEPSPGTHHAVQGLEHLLASDRPILALHASTSAFDEIPAWERSLGGRWVEGLSMHPEFGPASVRITELDHPVVSGFADFTVEDERYSFLRMAHASEVLIDHDLDDESHPLVWVSAGRRARTIVDVLGHDSRSYESPERRKLIEAELTWLLA